MLPANNEHHEDLGEWETIPELTADMSETIPAECLEQDLIEDDLLLSAEVILSHGNDGHNIGKIIKCKRLVDGNFIGCRHDNPICYTREYLVCYPDRTEDTVTYAKVIEHLYS